MRECMHAGGCGAVRARGAVAAHHLMVAVGVEVQVVAIVRVRQHACEVEEAEAALGLGKLLQLGIRLRQQGCARRRLPLADSLPPQPPTAAHVAAPRRVC